VREAVGVLRTAPTGIEVADASPWILVDDAQELTLGGVEMLEACRARGIAVMAFGDPDVGSGAFRGATPRTSHGLAVGLGGVSVLPGAHRGTAWQNELVRQVTQRIGAVGVVAHRGGRDERSRIIGPSSHAPITAEEYDAIARCSESAMCTTASPWSQCA
jgi:hypothetical protein